MSPPAHDYIFFADDRSSIPTSTMHIADQIAKTNRVFWVNIYTRLPKLSEFTKAFRILTRRGAKPAVNQQRGNQQEGGSTIISATPIQFPHFGFSARKFNGHFAGRFFKKLMRHYNIHHPVLATNFPCVVDAFRTIRQIVPHATQIYYCVDDYVEYPGLNSQHWEDMEQELFSIVDAALFTSMDLLENKKRPDSLPNIYLPHGVDYEHFACEDTKPKPIEVLEKIKKPIVGIFGTLDTRVDLSTIGYLAQRFPLCSFVVIGRANVPLPSWEEFKNVHYFGQIPYAELPQYARYFDVGLIPYVLNDYTKAINPLKLMEYYAIGMPVIAARLPDLKNMPGPLYFADTHEEFGNHLDTILHSDMPELRRQAKEVAQQNSWSARAESFMLFADRFKTVLFDEQTTL